ncbi:hypothetical protein [Actinoplanes sp. NPDC051494]|uniref:hypothetical protein n=1 Tax=Actinoplanes sp. NPDC051494 TaxID=3363907 RepID=UPI0037AEB40C
MSDIRTQTFSVSVSATVMPPLTEQEVRDAVADVAYRKEREHGMGALSVSVAEVLTEREYRL